ncbi:polyprotein [Phytophthora megakarya]|uniref:Polyprotein n=1 Tax=Phytophthora megakarya TaxID=4795 RepID=A0A225UCV3_9STRA|nr:polyprotein [Phytophthora megakarya]
MGLLHNCLGHVNMKQIKEMVAANIDFGLKLNMKSLKDYGCVPCLSAKFKRTTYKRNPNRKKVPLEKLSVDLCGVKPATVSGEEMFLLVVDEATRYTWCYLLKEKSEASALIQKLIL